MFADDEITKVPEPTLRRLPLYYQLLQTLNQQGRPVVSCSRIGRELALDPTQVRKDLAATGVAGKPKIGFDVPELIDAIERFLGWHNVTEAFLVGVGSLGTALLGFERFNAYGLHVVAAFDSDPARIGTVVHGREILPVEKLADLAQRMHALVGIITVPAEAAQSVADILVLAGARAIWNLAPTRLEVPDTVIVQNEDLFSSLAVLSSKLERLLRAEKGV